MEFIRIFFKKGEYRMRNCSRKMHFIKVLMQWCMIGCLALFPVHVFAASGSITLDPYNEDTGEVFESDITYCTDSSFEITGSAILYEDSTPTGEAGTDTYCDPTHPFGGEVVSASFKPSYGGCLAALKISIDGEELGSRPDGPRCITAIGVNYGFRQFVSKSDLGTGSHSVSIEIEDLASVGCYYHRGVIITHKIENGLVDQKSVSPKIIGPGESCPVDDPYIGGGSGSGSGGGDGGGCGSGSDPCTHGCPAGQGNPISILNGNNYKSYDDIVLPTPFVGGLKFSRFYNSRLDSAGTMGFGFTSLNDVRLEQYTTLDSGASDPSILIRSIDGEPLLFIPTDNGWEGMSSYLGIVSQQEDGSFQWHTKRGEILAFDASGALISQEDETGHTQTIFYDTEGRLETITDNATAKALTLHYNTDGLVAYITGPITDAVPDGVWVSYQYDDIGNLIQVAYADDNNGSTASGFEYKYEDPNDLHNMTEKRNLAGEFLSSWAYDSEDRAYENVTRHGKGVTIDGYGTSTMVVTDAQGNEKTYTIEIINGRKTITDISTGSGCASCGGNVARYTYDDLRRVIEKEYLNGRIDQFADYDNQDRYHTKIQAVGTPEERTFYYEYHPVSGDRTYIRETSVLGPGDKETIFDYDDDGNAIPNETPTRWLYRKIERGFTYDALGVIVPYENITTYIYTTSGQISSIDGPLPGGQDLVSYTYDAVTGDRLTETRPLVGTTTYIYDAAGNIETITDPNGVVTTFTYDGRNRQTAITRNGVTTSRTYTAAGELDTATDALGRSIDYNYNAAGFMEKILDPSGNFIYYGYNSLGQRTEESIHASDNSQTHYRGTDFGDPATNPDLAPGKPWKSLHLSPDNSTVLETVYTYNSSGNLASVTDANNNVTEYTYDAFDRLWQAIQPGNVTTTYGYDTHGNLKTVTDAEGHVTTYTYDDLGRLVQSVSPDTGTTLYSYDEAGNLRYKTLNGRTTEYQYDLLGRLTHILYADPAQNVTMTYDTGSGSYLFGRLASVTDPTGTVDYSYDAEGNLESEIRTISGITYVTGYGYDEAGNLRSIIYPTGHTITYQPDAVNQALIGGVLLDAGRNLASGLSYKPFGPISEMTLGNGIIVSKTYDKNYQLLSQSDSVLDRTYLPDNVGNIELITDNSDATRSQAFDYDSLYRLTFASGVYGTINYTYDKVGNRLSRTKTNSVNARDTYAYYSGTNRLQAVIGTHSELFQYDADGNTTARTPGAANPNPTVSDPSDYLYNTSGQRIQKAAGAANVYHYDLSGQLLAETDTNGNMIKAYVWLHGQPLAQIAADGSVYYYHNDHLGTPQRMSDGAGAVVWAADYLPFGQAEVTIETVGNNLRFAGQYYDNETGLHYNYHRYYDPKIGRYLRADPIGLNGDINLYIYASNSPILLVDRSGLSPCAFDPFPNFIKRKIDRAIENTIRSIRSATPCVKCDYSEIMDCSVGALEIYSCTRCGLCVNACRAAGHAASWCWANACPFDCGDCIGSLVFQAVECTWKNCEIGKLDPCTGKCKT